jgi:arylsulfatase A-like enzyme
MRSLTLKRRWILVLLASLAVSGVAAAGSRPNIVWIIVEDMSAHFGCYGETAIQTPHVDRLAAQGVKFTHTVITAPVCSAARSALVTGMYQTAIGAHQHRSGRGTLKIHLPAGVVPVPGLFQKAGYLSLNVTDQEFIRSDAEVKADPKVRVAKTDYNFEWDASIYDTTHWAARRSGQPFYCQVQLHGGKLRGTGDGERWPARVKKDLGSVTSTDAFKLPPYLPDDPVIRRDWAQYLDTVRYTDMQVGRIVQRLREAGELDHTYIFFITDHGISHVRNKQFCYEGGIHIPLVIHGPGIEAGSVRHDCVEHIDLAATSLALAGIAVPDTMQARDILARDYAPRKYVFSARDRCDETVERIRSVRSHQFKYIRNFYPQRPYLQPNRYKDNKPIIKVMRRLYAEGKLNPAQALIMAETRPEEELYDLQEDPFELRNLAADPRYQVTLREMRQTLDAWIVAADDRGRVPESTAMYDSDMAAYLKSQKDPEQNAILRRNIATMKQWALEGR